MTQSNLAKMVNKSKAWSHHGKRKGLAVELARQNREATAHSRPEMVSSVRDLFQGKQ